MESKLKQIIVNISNQEISISDIKSETILTTDLGFDSVKIIELIVEIETAFDIEIDDDDLDIEKLTIFGKLNNLVKSKI